jgi:hypothetical protein
MRDVSTRFRLISSESGVSTALAIQADLSVIYRNVAAATCEPGTPKKTMDAIVSRALNGVPVWRIRAIRLGEAGCASAAAVRKIQDEYKLFMQRRAKASAENALARARHDRVELEAARHEFRTQLDRIERMLARFDALDVSAADVDRP